MTHKASLVVCSFSLLPLSFSPGHDHKLFKARHFHALFLFWALIFQTQFSCEFLIYERKKRWNKTDASTVGAANWRAKQKINISNHRCNFVEFNSKTLAPLRYTTWRMLMTMVNSLVSAPSMWSTVAWGGECFNHINERIFEVVFGERNCCRNMWKNFIESIKICVAYKKKNKLYS